MICLNFLLHPLFLCLKDVHQALLFFFRQCLRISWQIKVIKILNYSFKYLFIKRIQNKNFCSFLFYFCTYLFRFYIVKLAIKVPGGQQLLFDSRINRRPEIFSANDMHVQVKYGLPCIPVCINDKPVPSFIDAKFFCDDLCCKK